MVQRGRGDDRPSLEERVDELQRVVSLLTFKMQRDFGCDLDRTPGSIHFLDAVIAELRREGRELSPGLYLSIGGYLGETLVHTYGGHWADEDGMLGVRLQGGGHSRYLRVFDWVQRAFEDPRTQSLSYQLSNLVGWSRGWDEPGGSSGLASA